MSKRYLVESEIDEEFSLVANRSTDANQFAKRGDRRAAREIVGLEEELTTQQKNGQQMEERLKSVENKGNKHGIFSRGEKDKS